MKYKIENARFNWFYDDYIKTKMNYNYKFIFFIISYKSNQLSVCNPS